MATDKQIVGFLVSEADGLGIRKQWQGFRVAARAPGSLFHFKGQELASTISAGGGRFELHVRPMPTIGDRRLEIVAYDKAGREIPFAPLDEAFPGYVVTESGRAQIEDKGEDTQRVYGSFVIREADGFGPLTTLGTGKVRHFTQGNRVTTLMDRDAFRCAAAMMRQARQEILISQLFFAIPKVFDGDPTRETPNLIFEFDPPGDLVNLAEPRAVQADDRRPERALLLSSQRGVDVRILLHAFTVPLFIKIAVGVLLFPFVGTEGISIVKELLGTDLTDTDEVKGYFAAAGAENVKVQALEQPVLSAGVMHAKLMMMDRGRMLSIGSPFGQSYVDRQDHLIDAWIRGGADGFPKHDAGFTMTGPAHAGFFETMELFWNDAAGPNDKLPGELKDPHFPPMVPPPPDSSSFLDRPEDGVCAVQLVRTLSCDQFDGSPQGEKGILEAYLRGIAQAKDFIYLETQYFTNDAIGDALVDVMLSTPELKVILLLNIEPDVPTYPFKQRRLITRIRRAIGQTPTGPQRFGVFTRWTHQHDGPRPRLLPVYIHAKVGIIDNNWATIGSANLDGLSLDSSLPSDILNGLFNRNEQRAIEVNAVFFDDEDPPNNVVDILRRKLWAEHLGFLTAAGLPNIGALPIQVENKPANGWLQLWSTLAAETLQHVTDRPSQSSHGLARVLPWPTDNSTYKTPRKHLDALGVKSFRVAPLKSTRAFDFKTGDFKADSKAKMDFD
jgi:phosphatidylserine/phosphatidylglycerophosphate/cardiolipin synthase-like enzyme